MNTSDDDPIFPQVNVWVYHVTGECYRAWAGKRAVADLEHIIKMAAEGKLKQKPGGSLTCAELGVPDPCPHCEAAAT